ncbi:MAG: hypothetical protein AAFQ27_11735 [Pseudomonadota bacterium]
MLDLLIEYRDEAQRVVSLLLGLAMLRWGGAPERAIALVFLGIITVPVIATGFLVSESLILSDLGVLYAALDIIAAIAFVIIALNANRNYPLWIAGFQLVAAAAHLVRGFIDSITPIAYAVMVIGPSYFQLMLMAAGLYRHIQRKKHYGEYRSWRPSPNKIALPSAPEGRG